MVRGVGGETKSEKFNVCQQACDDAAPIMRCSRFLIVCAVIAAAACAACGGAGSPAGAVTASRALTHNLARDLKPETRAALVKERKLTPAIEQQLNEAIGVFQAQFKAS